MKGSIEWHDMGIKRQSNAELKSRDGAIRNKGDSDKGNLLRGKGMEKSEEKGRGISDRKIWECREEWREGGQ